MLGIYGIITLRLCQRTIGEKIKIPWNCKFNIQFEIFNNFLNLWEEISMHIYDLPLLTDVSTDTYFGMTIDMVDEMSVAIPDKDIDVSHY